jgi:hypothetical protein
MEPTAVEYRDIHGFAGYRVGSDGSVWSRWEYNGRNPRRLGEWRRMRATIGTGGYPGLGLYRERRARYRKVHLLVLEAFVGPRPPGMQGCHENGIPSDCRLGNLRWDTPKSNQADRLKHGTDCRGEKNAIAKLTEADVIEIRRRRLGGERGAVLAREYGVSQSTIAAIKTGQNWRWLSGADLSSEEGRV